MDSNERFARMVQLERTLAKLVRSARPGERRREDKWELLGGERRGARVVFTPSSTAY